MLCGDHANIKFEWPTFNVPRLVLFLKRFSCSELSVDCHISHAAQQEIQKCSSNIFCVNEISKFKDNASLK